MPNMLAMYAKAGLYDYCKDYHIDYCFGCGTCARVCPSKIPLLRYINIAKRELTKEVAKNNAPRMTIRPEKGAKSEPKIKKLYPIVFVIVLAAIMLTLLALVESDTRAKLESYQDQQTLEMIQQIFPEVSYYILEEDICIIYNNVRNEIGYAFYGEGWGYGGKMLILVGLEDKETIKGIIVVSHIEGWQYWNSLAESNYFDQFIGLRIEDCYLKYSYDGGGQVDGVTGATVSSMAVVDIVRKAALEKIESIR